jgi:hypothetical protein
MHVYFRQTEHFAALFPKQVYAGDYDLKGMGGGQVVAEGCLRQDTGEVRIGNGKPVITIPDWLTDWLKKDSGPLVAAINAKKREDAKALARVKPGDMVPTGKRTLFLTNLASRLFENRVSRKPHTRDWGLVSQADTHLLQLLVGTCVFPNTLR